MRTVFRRLTWSTGALALAGSAVAVTLGAQSPLSVHRCRSLPAGAQRVAACREVVRDAERDPTGYLDLARALLSADRYDEALAAFVRAGRLAPKSAEPRHGARFRAQSAS